MVRALPRRSQIADREQPKRLRAARIVATSRRINLECTVAIWDIVYLTQPFVTLAFRSQSSVGKDRLEKDAMLVAWDKVQAGFDLIVDDQGRTLHVGTAEVNRILSLPEVDGNLENFLVRNLGFIRVRSSGSNLIVMLRPLTVNRKTFEAASWIIVRDDPRRVALHTLGPADGYELMFDAEEAVLRLQDLCFGTETATAGAHVAESLSLARLSEPRLAPFRKMVDAWFASRGQLPANSNGVEDQIAPGGRFLLVRMGPGDPVIQTIHGYDRLYGPTWAERMPGRYVEDQPDSDYGRFVVEAFRQTEIEAKPRLQLVDATVRESGLISRRFRYERLLLPWRSANASFVTSSSIVRTSLLSSSATMA